MSVKKTPERAQGRRKHMELVPVVQVEVPAPPEGLEPEVEADWHRFWATDYSRVVNWDRDKAALERLFKLYSLRLRLEDACRDIYMLGSQGQQILNPALRQLSSVGGEITTLEKLFGMNPQSAAGLGLSLGGLRRSLQERSTASHGHEAKQRKA